MVTGGATAANDIALYQNGALIASTASNNAGYVAMENGTNPAAVGGYSNSGAGTFMDGSMGFAAMYAAALNVAQHLEVKRAANKYYGLTL
mgnify:FL=1